MKSYLFLFLSLFLTVSLFSQDLDNIKNQKPFKINGGISLGSFYNSSSGIRSRVPQMGYSLSARSNISLYGISIPFSIHFNEQGNSFNQPFNKYGMSPKYKWIKLHLGWRSMSMSKFTLANSSFLGVGLELTPWKLRFSAMYGSFNRAAGVNNPNYYRPQFERKGYAVKLGVGTDKNYFDLIFFKAKDDTLSINVPDSIYNLIPANENAVLGLNSKFGFWKNKLSFHLEGALSAFTLNTRYANIPDEENAILKKISKIYTPNISSQLNYAVESGVTFKLKAFSIATSYRRVMPEYKSLGANYILDDLEAITLTPTFSFLKRKVIISGSIGLQRNNLNGFRQSDGSKKIGSVNIQVSPKPEYGLSASYSNYTFRQQVIRDNFVGDSLLINQINHNINLVPRYTIMNEKSVQNIILVLNYQVLDDKNTVTEQFADNNILMANLNYSFLSKKTRLTLRGGMNYFKFNSNIVTLNRFGVNIGASKLFFKDKFRLGLNSSVSKQKQLNVDRIMIVFNSDMRYNFTKKLGLSLRMFMNNNMLPENSYKEIRAQMSISARF